VHPEEKTGESNSMMNKRYFMAARLGAGLAFIILASTSADVLRPTLPNARIVDVVGVSPTRATVVLKGDEPEMSFFNLWAGYTGDELVTFIQASPFGGSVQFPADQNLSLEAAADKFIGLHPANSLLVARIGPAGDCQPMISRSSETPRGLGSIFKMWVLAALAERLDTRLSDPDNLINLVAAKLAAGGIINNEPLGTQFSVREMAILMLAFSDNTSTDHLHELVGREAIADQLVDLGLSNPDLLLPFLNISEQFHVFTRFDLPKARRFRSASRSSTTACCRPIPGAPRPSTSAAPLRGSTPWSAAAADSMSSTRPWATRPPSPGSATNGSGSGTRAAA
jgi:hypothetical protein